MVPLSQWPFADGSTGMALTSHSGWRLIEDQKSHPHGTEKMKARRAQESYRASGEVRRQLPLWDDESCAQTKGVL